MTARLSIFVSLVPCLYFRGVCVGYISVVLPKEEKKAYVVMSILDGFDQKNVELWEEQMKNSQVPIGGDVSGTEDSKQTAKFEFMNSHVSEWENRLNKPSAVPIGSHEGNCGCGDDEESEEEEKTFGYMGSEVDAWEKSRSKIGAQVEVVAEEVVPEVPKQKKEAFSFMTEDVKAWEEAQKGS